MIPTKAHLRRGMLVHRDALPPTAVERMARDFADQLELVAAWRKAALPCVYASFGGEASTRVILHEAFSAGRDVAVPRIQGSDIRLYRVGSFDHLAPGRFGIDEPLEVCPEVPPAEVDAFVIPGVAFDRRGHRVGFGKGFYDRLLARAAAGVPVIGLAYGFQVVNHIPDEPHDRTVDILVTPHAVIPCTT